MRFILWFALASVPVVLLTAWVVNTGRARDVSLLRWTVCFTLPAAIALYGHARRSLDPPACALAFLVGYSATLASGCFSATIIAFFLTSSRLTKWKKTEKEKFEAEDGGGAGSARNWKQVFCNGFVATLTSIVYIYTAGPVEEPLVIHPLYLHPPTLISLACLGAISCCCGDTWASEIGAVLGLTPRLVTSLKPVPRGTNGGVSLPGLAASALGGLLVGVVYYVTQFLLVDSSQYSFEARMSPQWVVIPLGTLGGLLGSLTDSLLGATLQYSGVDENTRRITHKPSSKDVKHISGLDILSNNSVNLLSSAITAVLLPIIGMMLT